MTPHTIEPIAHVTGVVSMPGDKSISHRAVMIGALAEGKTTVSNVLDCDDCRYTVSAFQHMGVPIDEVPEKSELTIQGVGLRGLKRPLDGEIFVGESGTTMRLLAGILAGQNFDVSITGDLSLSKRPMARVVDPLRSMGVNISSASGGLPPLSVTGGPVQPINYRMEIPSAQVKSSVLFAGLYSDGITTVTEPVRSRDHTERMLRFFGSDITVRGVSVSVKGNLPLSARHVEVPGDLSSAAFFMVAATIMPGSYITVRSVGLNQTRSGLLDVLLRMGAAIRIHNVKEHCEPVGDITVESAETRGVIIHVEELPRLIDEVPILMVLAAVSEGRTVIRGARELRVKETDRITSMKVNLKKMGAQVSVERDDIFIDGVKSLNGASLESFGDHRTAMSLMIAASAASGSSELDDVICISKSFPGFAATLAKLAG